jgi:hypothetical protein
MAIRCLSPLIMQNGAENPRQSIDAYLELDQPSRSPVKLSSSWKMLTKFR